MARTENHSSQTEGGFLSRQLHRVVETVGNVALLGVAVLATISVAGELLHEFDDSLIHPLDGDLE